MVFFVCEKKNINYSANNCFKAKQRNLTVYEIAKEDYPDE